MLVQVASAAPYAPLAPALCPRTAQGRPDVGRAVNAGPLSAQDEAAESRSMVASTMHYTKRGAKASSNPVSDFFTKVSQLWARGATCMSNATLAPHACCTCRLAALFIMHHVMQRSCMLCLVWSGEHGVAHLLP